MSTNRILYVIVAACYAIGGGLLLILLTDVIRVTILIRHAADWWMFSIGPLH